MTEGTVWDAPNQQVVRRDASAPWDEGDGGEPGPNEPGNPVGDTVDLDVMTKDELLAYGQSLGITPMNAGMTKEEIRAGIDAHQG
jgi:hypothetical protein